MDPRQTEELLARIPFLSGLEPEARRLFAGLVKLRRYPKRKVVVWEGEPGDALFLVISGFLKAVTASGEGHEVLLSIMGPGEVFGELSVFDGQPRSASVVALDSVEVATLERGPVRALIEQSPKLATSLIEVLAQRLRNLSKRCENVDCMDVRTRLAQALVELAEKHGQGNGLGVQIPFKISQQDLGNWVGTSRESVNKLLRDWSKNGMLSHRAGLVIINDLPAFRSMTAH
jgi:CRP-like cAMP-binding protein